jgi:hypothetical protein
VPRRRNRLSSTATSSAAPAGRSVATISRATTRPSWSADQAWVEKNRCTRSWATTACIPAPTSMPVMVHAPVWVIIPTASRQNTSNGRSRKQDRNPCSSSASEPGTVSPASISGFPSLKDGMGHRGCFLTSPHEHPTRSGVAAASARRASQVVWHASR